MANVAERFAQMERCRNCFAMLPAPPAPRVCGDCGAAKIVPRWSEWGHTLRVYLILQFAVRHLFPDFRSLQDSWELLLIGNYEGMRDGRRRGDTDDLYTRAVTDAEAWQASGAKSEFLQGD